jgi:hypothetical protein
MSLGIDYGRGQTNIDHKTGIHYGVISQHSVSQAWYDSAESDYGTPHCGECGNDATPSDSHDLPDDVVEADWFDGKDFCCLSCERCFWSEEAYSDEPLGWALDDGEYKAVDCLDSDIMILFSPYYTYGPFCSPCVPGAINLDDADMDDKTGKTAQQFHADAKYVGYPRAYCFGHDWFDGGKAPYRVFRVSDDTEVVPE